MILLVFSMVLHWGLVFSSRARRVSVGRRNKIGVTAGAITAIAFSQMLASCGDVQNPALAPPEPGPTESGPSEPILSESTQSPSESATSQVIGEPILSDHALIPGRHCYFLESETLKAAISLTVAEDDQVTGESQGTIANEAMGYYSSYVQTLNGSITQDQLALDVATYIEEDQQREQVSWRMANDQLDTGREVYNQVDCSVVEAQLASARRAVAVIPSPSESEAEGSTDGTLSEASALRNGLTEGAEFVRVRRLDFAPGLSSGRVEDAVVRAHRDEYLLGAMAGQTMTLSIDSLEQNAVFGLVAPDGSVLANEETILELKLPQNGDYSIVVGGTRGNASYGLAIEIQ